MGWKQGGAPPAEMSPGRRRQLETPALIATLPPFYTANAA